MQIVQLNKAGDAASHSSNTDQNGFIYMQVKNGLCYLLAIGHADQLASNYIRTYLQLSAFYLNDDVAIFIKEQWNVFWLTNRSCSAFLKGSFKSIETRVEDLTGMQLIEYWGIYM
jgi:hypothetical protein